MADVSFFFPHDPGRTVMLVYVKRCVCSFKVFGFTLRTSSGECARKTTANTENNRCVSCYSGARQQDISVFKPPQQESIQAFASNTETAKCSSY